MRLLLLCVHARGVSFEVASAGCTVELDAILDKADHDAHLLGLAAVIVDHGKVVLEKGYGFTDLDRKTPITADTVFEIGSLSKQFTAAAVLRLVDDGKSEVDRPRRVVSARGPQGTSRSEQLMWQTSGLAGLRARHQPRQESATSWSHVIATMTPEFPAGTRWEYSNSNYFLLGRDRRGRQQAPARGFPARRGDRARRHDRDGDAARAQPRRAGAARRRSSAGAAGRRERAAPTLRFYGGAGAVLLDRPRSAALAGCAVRRQGAVARPGSRR